MPDKNKNIDPEIANDFISPAAIMLGIFIGKKLINTDETDD